MNDCSSSLSSLDTAGILGGESAEADWKHTLRLAEQRFEDNERLKWEARESRERGRTIPEWEVQSERALQRDSFASL